MAFKHAISWFEIPATDITRAQKFYEAIFELTLVSLDTDQFKMRMFPVEDAATGIGGCIILSEGFYKPSATDGVLIYLDGNPDVKIILDRVEGAGGKVVMPKTQISPEYGYMGLFLDTEGNRIGLHNR
jgi:uncharacterized protein